MPLSTLPLVLVSTSETSVNVPPVRQFGMVRTYTCPFLNTGIRRTIGFHMTLGIAQVVALHLEMTQLIFGDHNESRKED